MKHLVLLVIAQISMTYEFAPKIMSCIEKLVNQMYFCGMFSWLNFSIRDPEEFCILNK